MPRQVRDSNLETRAARGRLKVAHKPYFRLIEPGFHLGYRKLAAGPGKWVVRRYQSGSGYAVTNLRTAMGALVVADDYADANGKSVMSFAQAQNAARGKSQASAGTGTVAAAMEDYFKFLETEGRSERSIQDARGRSNALIIP